MHCLSEILYEYLATAEGLSEWFADEVTEKGDDFFFSWGGGPAEKATLIRYKPEGFVRFRWEEDEGTKNFFEMTIVIDDITEDLSLILQISVKKVMKMKMQCIGKILLKILE
jgi:uncharacterized protein YndB with AHSA1/START domain